MIFYQTIKTGIEFFKAMHFMPFSYQKANHILVLSVLETI
jgi:hypothetical protein